MDNLINLNDLTGINDKTLFTTALIVAIIVIGFVQFLKTFITSEKSHHGKTFAIIAFLGCMLVAFVNTNWIPIAFTRTFNLFGVSLAVMQLGYEGIKKGLVEMPDKIFQAIIKRIEKE